MAPRTQEARPRAAARSSAAPAIRVEGGVVQRSPRNGAAASASASARSSARNASARTARAKRVFTAAGADRHELYQLSVQSPKEDCAFFARAYKKLRGKDARHFREDFCGTALNSSEWVRRNSENTAEGFDIDPDPISWGVEHNFAPLGEKAARCTLHLKDVREPSARRPDLRTATNFSWWVFKQRAELLEYCRSAYRDLKKDGVFILDIYGGPDAMHEMEETRRIDGGFTYVWDQISYFPATGDYKAAIHFRFKDGTELKRAFRYDWRFWGLTELVDVLRDAGFPTVETWWEGTDEDGVSGNGIYHRHKRGENCEAWVTYVVAAK